MVLKNVVVLKNVDGCFVRSAISGGTQKSGGLFYVGGSFECVWYSKEWRAVLTGGCFEWYSQEWRVLLCGGLF